MQPIVSVCVVTYQHVRYIERCLSSIVRQDAPFPFEVIVGDDASTDGTGEIVSGFVRDHPGRVRAIFHSKNVGAAANYRAVHLAARGHYVAHVDGDDACMAGKLVKQVRALEADANASAVFHRVAVVDSAGRATGEIFDRNAPRVSELEHLLLNHPISVHSSMMYRRGLLDGFLSQSNRFIDFRVYVELARYGHHIHLPDVLGTYTSSVGMVSKQPVENLLNWHLDAVAAAEHAGIDPSPAIRARSRIYLKHALMALRKHDDDLFLRLVEQCDTRSLGSVLGHLVYMGRRAPAVLRILDQIDAKLAASRLYRRHLRI